MLSACADASRPLEPALDTPAAESRLDGSIAAYTIHDLGTLPGTTLGCCSEGHDVNAAGDVAGYSTHSNGSFHAVIWTPTGIRDLGVPAGFSDTFAEGLNDAGVVVGFANTGTIQPTAAFVWTAASGMTLLRGPGATPVNIIANDINNGGEIVGQLAVGSRFHAYRHTSAGGYVDIHPAGYLNSNALAIAENGDVAGEVVLFNFDEHAALWRANGTFVDLGSLGGREATAFGLNSLGTVVGRSTNPQNVEFGFVWRSGTGLRPSPQPGGANDVSDGDRIVGYGISGIMRVPVTKLGGGPITPLPQFAGRRGGEAVAVNRCGVITGSARLLINGAISTHGTRWVPSRCDP